MKKLFSLFAALLCASVMTVFAETATETLTCSTGTVVENTLSFATDNFTIVCAKGEGSNFASYSPWRIYKGNTITITGNKYVAGITKVDLVHNGTYYGSFSSSEGTIVMASSSGGTSTLTISDEGVTSVVLTQNGSSQTRLSSIAITYTKAEITDPEIAISDKAFNVVPVGFEKEETVTVTGLNLTQAITASLPDNSQFELDGTLTKDGGVLTITAKPTAAGEIEETLTLAAGTEATATAKLSMTAVATTGVGTEANPFTCTDLVNLNNGWGGNYWVHGFIIENNAGDLAIADDDNGEKQVSVQLAASADLRAALNPTVGMEVKLIGSLENYNNMPGVKTLTDIYEVVAATTYDITVNPAINGTVSADKDEAEEGETVTLTITPNDGYQLKSVEVLKMSDNDKVEVTENYTFQMPASNVIVSVEFEEIPVSGCNWDDLEWLGTTDSNYANQFKICLGTPAPSVVNIQQPGFAGEIGIYVTFPAAAFTSFSLDENKYAVQGAGVILYLSAFTAKETEVTIVESGVDYVFTVYNDKGTEAGGTYTITVAEAANGTVATDKTEAEEGDLITITVTPDAGYELNYVTVQKEDNSYVIVETNNTFYMPASNVTVTAVFQVAAAQPETVTMVPDEAEMYYVDTYSQWLIRLYQYDEEDNEKAFVEVWIDGTADVKPTSVTDINAIDAAYSYFMFAKSEGDTLWSSDNGLADINLSLSYSNEQQTESQGYLITYVITTISGEITDVDGNKMVITESDIITITDYEQIQEAMSLTEFIEAAPTEAVELKDLTVIFASGKNTYVIDEEGTALVMYDANKTYYDGTLTAGKVLSGQQATYTIYNNQDEIIPANTVDATDGVVPVPTLLNAQPTTEQVNKYVRLEGVEAAANGNFYYAYDGDLQLYGATGSLKPSKDGIYNLEGIIINFKGTQLELIVTAIEEVPATSIDGINNAKSVRKLIENNQVIILRDGKRYNVIGTEVK